MQITDINDFDIEFLDETDSTNNEAKRRLERYDREGLSFTGPFVIVARSQTAGRGRQGKSFYSPKGTGIYLTVTCPLDCPITGQVTMTSRTATAVCRAIDRAFGIEPGIKWVNDIYVNGRKCCGILCEAVNDYPAGILKYAVIGVGVNITTDIWPDDIKDSAGALVCMSDDKTGTKTLSDETFTGFGKILAQEILRAIYHPSEDDMKYYREHSLVLGKEITYTENGTVCGGTAVGIDDNGGLIVRIDQNRTLTLDSGEITVRLA